MNVVVRAVIVVARLFWLRNVVGQHTLDETLADTEVINANIRQTLEKRAKVIAAEGESLAAATLGDASEP